MADVYAVFGTLLALGIAFPGMLTGCWLLFPGAVERAGNRIQSTPWKCLLLGTAGALIVTPPIVILSAIPFGPVKFAGAMLLFGILGFAGVGAAGLAWAMAQRLAGRAQPGLSPAAAFVRAAVALELTAAFPVIGWFLAIPLSALTSLGASTFAVLRWQPRAAVRTAPQAAAAGD